MGDRCRGGDSHFLNPLGWIRWLYDWVLSLAERPGGAWALFLIAFAESSFFPIPPDVLLIPMAIGAPRRALWLAGLCTAGSVIGGAAGYFLGFHFYELIGRRIIEFYSMSDQYERVRLLYQEWDAIVVAIAGFTPIPYKVFTIAAGVFHLNVPTFLLASLLGRGGRFFLLGGMILWFGPSIRAFIDRYFDALAVLFVVLLVGGFLILRYAI